MYMNMNMNKKIVFLVMLTVSRLNASNLGLVPDLVTKNNHEDPVKEFFEIVEYIFLIFSPFLSLQCLGELNNMLTKHTLFWKC